MEEDNILIICRHSERIDCSKEYENQRSKRGDPELTSNGINLSKTLGQKILSEFKSYVEQNKIKLYVSPFTRTLQTAIAMRNEMQKNLEKTSQELFIIKNLGEVNFYSFNLYPNILYYNKENNSELYQDLILRKMHEGKINYEINNIENGDIKYKETRLEADERYVKVLKKLIDELKGKQSNLVIIMQHGEGVAACCRYLCEKIKEKSGNQNNKLYSDFLNIITGDNQNYCNSFCFKLSKNGENISFYDEIFYKPEINIDSKIIIYENNYKTKLIEWLKNPNNKIKDQNKNIKEILLLYRGSRDGYQ